MKRSERKELKNKIKDQTQKLFGELIAELRKKADLTQEDLAYNSGIDRSFMSKLERGENSISLQTLLRLSKALNMAPSKILARFEKLLKANNVEIPLEND